ncbi:hypothetical protein SFRURICE_004067 [Spodoptera frugiperda]|nr:hypothetical protein SFRURICE_004067 [Spodoptera frugiperda]
MAFLIIAAVLLFVNTIFLVGSLVYTLKTTNKGDGNLGFGANLNPRMSLQPQVVFYDAIVRISGNPLPGGEFHNQQQITEKTENQTKTAYFGRTP